mmetsp:Transcript_20958/g.72328  ORF Transcript_20958/g.72328 Transcript_20958/m.72328 type:complete len:204 (-) Transcript_20958:1111-1722(-)
MPPWWRRHCRWQGPRTRWSPPRRPQKPPKAPLSWPACRLTAQAPPRVHCSSPSPRHRRRRWLCRWCRPATPWIQKNPSCNSCPGPSLRGFCIRTSVTPPKTPPTSATPPPRPPLPGARRSLASPPSRAYPGVHLRPTSLRDCGAGSRSTPRRAQPPSGPCGPWSRSSATRTRGPPRCRICAAPWPGRTASPDPSARPRSRGRG